jgi:putative transposase
MYRWRKLTPEQREEERIQRHLRRRPEHSPGHHNHVSGPFLITSTCYEHRPYIGRSPERMDAFSSELLQVLGDHSRQVEAWVILPNHYHALVVVDSCRPLLQALGRLHGRTSRLWNQQDGQMGRKVWFNTLDRIIEGDRHFVTAIHYIHHNPVKHGHARKWDDWKWSSAADYIAKIGREEALRRWTEFPLLHFGSGWDDGC